MVKKRGSNGKRQYILRVCNMTCLNVCCFLRYLLRRRRLILGRLVESHNPLEKFFNFLKFLLLKCVYAPILNKNYEKKLISEKIDLRVQNTLKKIQVV